MKKDKISVFNPGFIDNLFTWHNICYRYVIMLNVSLNETTFLNETTLYETTFYETTFLST